MPVLLPPYCWYDDGVRTGVVGTLNRAEANVLRHEETLQGRTDFKCEGFLWLWCDAALPADLGELDQALSDRELFLADGHHRYEAGWNWAMIQTRDESLRSLPSHRLIREKRGMLLPETEAIGDADLYLATTPADRWRAVMRERGREARGIELARSFPLTELFRDAVVEPVRAIEQEQAELVLMVAAYTVAQIEDYARRGALLPPKSTDFFPKLQSEKVTPATAQRRGVR